MHLSLAQWSLHRLIESGALRGLDFPSFSRREFGIGVVELVNGLLESHDAPALRALRAQADAEGVEIFLVMVDDEGDLAATDDRERRAAVDRHRAWIDRTRELGARAMRVNTGAEDLIRWDTPVDAPELESTIERCGESLARLADHALDAGIDVLVENHGGLSSHIDGILETLRRVDRPNLGTLPDFGNFEPRADPYGSVERLLVHAKAVSAKCFDFDASGNESSFDFARMIELVQASGYDGAIGIEYEGRRLDEVEGVRRAQALLARLLGI